MVVLIAIALAAGLVWPGRWRWPVRLAAGAAVVFLVGGVPRPVPATARPSRVRGSFETTQRVARAAGGPPGRVPVGAGRVHGRSPPCSARRSGSRKARSARRSRSRATVPPTCGRSPAASGQPVFVVTVQRARPNGYGDLEFVRADHIAGSRRCGRRATSPGRHMPTNGRSTSPSGGWWAPELARWPAEPVPSPLVEGATLYPRGAARASRCSTRWPAHERLYTHPAP